MAHNYDMAALVPHAGAMILLDQVMSHDAERVHCRTELGDLAQHPLAHDGILPATALAELGAQAMAVHGSLSEDNNAMPRRGHLVALAKLVLTVEQIVRPLCLDIHAQRLGGNEGGQMYDFEVRHGDQVLAQGRATIMFMQQGDTK